MVPTNPVGYTQIFSFRENQTLTIPEITAAYSIHVVSFIPEMNSV
jgi:hypothetical protein